MRHSRQTLVDARRTYAKVLEGGGIERQKMSDALKGIVEIQRAIKAIDEPGRGRIAQRGAVSDRPSANQSLPVLEAVCECRKRKLKKGNQRRAAETYRLGAGSSPFVRQEPG